MHTPCEDLFEDALENFRVVNFSILPVTAVDDTMKDAELWRADLLLWFIISTDE